MYKSFDWLLKIPSIQNCPGKWWKWNNLMKINKRLRECWSNSCGNCAAKNPRQLNACKQTDVSSKVEGAEIGQCRGHMSHNIDGFTPHGGELWLWGFDLRFGRQVYNIILEVIWLSILSIGTGYSQDLGIYHCWGRFYILWLVWHFARLSDPTPMWKGSDSQ